MMKQKGLKQYKENKRLKIQERKIRKLIFIRHGDYGNDGSLTESAKEKVKALAQKLKEEFENEGIQTIRIITSPLRRAKETASILSKILSANVKVDEDVGNEMPKERVEAAVKDIWKRMLMPCL